MSSNRFFVPASSIEGEQAHLSPEQAHQVCHVLRLEPGDTLVVLDDTGLEYHVTLTTVDLQETVGQITARRPARGEPAVQLALFQSLLAREKFEWVLQKGTEVGVTQFVPVMTERSIVRAKMIEERKLDRWRHILTEAAEQSHRGRIPRLDRATSFTDALSTLAGFDRALIAVPSQDAVTLKEALAGGDKPPSSVALLIGPEGGFSEKEVAAACERRAVRVHFGPRVMRTETAAVVACALVLYELGEMGAAR